MTCLPMNAGPVIEIYYFDAGGGHRNAMRAIAEVMAARYPGHRIVPVDLQKLLEPIDPVHRMTRGLHRSLARVIGPDRAGSMAQPVQSQDLYNGALRRGTTRGLGAILPLLQAYVRRRHQAICSLLRARWHDVATARPALVVSVIPNFNRPLKAALSATHPGVPYLTIITDMADLPPNFWMERQDQHIVCGTKVSEAQARSSGFYRPGQIHPVSGMLLRPSFHAPRSPGFNLARLGLREDRPTLLVMFGGNGSYRATHTILDRLGGARRDLQFIILCGSNRKLLESLQGRPDCHATGMVDNVADYMRLADIVIGKPGPGTISEAVHLGRPIIVEGNGATMPQERPNLDFIRDNGVGLVVRAFDKDIVNAVAAMLGDLSRYHTNIASNLPENRAIFEVAELLVALAEDGQRAVTAA